MQPSRIVFLVHGHNNQITLEVAQFLEVILGHRPIIVHEQADKGRMIIEKFEAYAGEAGFAVVLLTGDDEGRVVRDHCPRSCRLASTSPSDQNVILEHGFFVGKLGRDRVVVLYEDGVEIPSDLSDMCLYKPPAGNWQAELVLELKAAGFEVAQDSTSPQQPGQLINMDKFLEYRQAIKPVE